MLRSTSLFCPTTLICRHNLPGPTGQKTDVATPKNREETHVHVTVSFSKKRGTAQVPQIEPLPHAQLNAGKTCLLTMTPMFIYTATRTVFIKSPRGRSV